MKLSNNKEEGKWQVEGNWTSPPQPSKYHSKYSARTDKEIWNDFKRGDDEAFSHIYRNYTQRLFNYAYQHVQNREMIKDCIQNLYVALRSNRKKLPEVNSIGAYLYKAIYRQVMRALESEKILISGSELAESAFHIELSFEETVIGMEIKEEMREHLRQLLEAMTPKQRKAILLYYKENLSYAEVAEAMELKNSKSARKLIYRALFNARKDNLGLGDWLKAFIIILFFSVLKTLSLR